MADNTQLNIGASGDLISTDVITTLNGGAVVTGEKAQRVKVGWGVDATFNDTSATNPLPVAQQTAASSAITSVVGSITSVTVLAANTSRKGAYFFNESTSILYLAFASTASTTAYTVQVASNGYFEMPYKPLYTGLITGIWATASGNVRITELS